MRRFESGVLANVARCLAARERLPSTTRVLDSGAHTSDELAAMVLSRPISPPDRLLRLRKG